MSRYLLKVEELYRCDTEAEAEMLVSDMKTDPTFELVGYANTRKVTKNDEYFVVKIKKLYNNEKNPC